jgi:hypothetical protein
MAIRVTRGNMMILGVHLERDGRDEVASEELQRRRRERFGRKP